MSQYNIHIASQLSGVAAATIRAWEKRYKALVPDRADNGHRLYSDIDIEKLTIASASHPILVTLFLKLTRSNVRRTQRAYSKNRREFNRVNL